MRHNGVLEQVVLGISHCVEAVGCLECTTGSKRDKPKKDDEQGMGQGLEDIIIFGTEGGRMECRRRRARRNPRTYNERSFDGPLR